MTCWCAGTCSRSARCDSDGVDTVVASAGRSSDSSLFEELEDLGAEPVRVGDALGPRSFEEAIREGTEAGLEAVSAPAALH